MNSTSVSVLLSGPPCVITYGSLKIWKAAIIVTTPTNTKVGPSIGTVTWRKRCHCPAPSSSAAS